MTPRRPRSPLVTPSRALMRIIHGVTASNAERVTGDLTVRERLLVQRLGLEGDKAIAALGQTLGITASSMTNMVDRLEQKGHLRRIFHPTDRRTTLLSLTSRGQAAFARELDFYGSLIDQTLTPLGVEARAAVLHALAMLEAPRSERSGADARTDGQSRKTTAAGGGR